MLVHARIYLGALPTPYLTLAALAGALTYLLLGRYPIGGRWQVGTPGSVGSRLARGWGWVLTGLLLIGFASGWSEYFSRAVLISWAVAAPLSFLGVHVAVRALARHRPLPAWLRQSAVIVFDHAPSSSLLHVVGESPGYELKGYFHDDVAARPPGGSAWQRLGSAAEAVRYVAAEAIDAVFLQGSPGAEQFPELLAGLRDAGVAIYLVNASADAVVAPFERIDGLPMGRTGKTANDSTRSAAFWRWQ
jgi:hypothetical protein